MYGPFSIRAKDVLDTDRPALDDKKKNERIISGFDIHFLLDHCKIQEFIYTMSKGMLYSDMTP